MARQPAGSPVLEALLEEYEYDGIETCAADGTCALACPLGIDTGKLVKELRAQRAHRPRASSAGAARWRGAGRRSSARRAAGLRAGDAARGRPRRRCGAPAGRAPRRSATSWSPSGRAMPRPAPARLPRDRRDGAAAVYLPACVNRIFGRARGDGGRRPGLPEALVAVSARAGHAGLDPGRRRRATAARRRGARRATPTAHARMANHTRRGALALERRRRAAGRDRRQLLHARPRRGGGTAARATITPSATRELRDPRLDRVGARAPAAEARADAQARLVAVHPTCSTRHLGLDARAARARRGARRRGRRPARRHLLRLRRRPRLAAPRAAARGDRRRRRPSSASRRFDAHLCSNRTCEIGLQQGTGRPTSPSSTLEELTRG